VSVASVACCHVEVSATGRLLVQRSPTECGVSECDREASITKSWPTRGCCTLGGRGCIGGAIDWDVAVASVSQLAAAGAETDLFNRQ
jgi:hypothetical protein